MGLKRAVKLPAGVPTGFIMKLPKGFMQVKLPELPDLNTYISAERGNRFIAAKIKNEATDLVAWYFKAAKVKPIKRIKKLTFIWYHKNKRKDFDNVEFSQKFIRDGMVRSGVIANDGWANMPPRTLHKHEINPDEAGVLVIYK